MTKIAIQDSAFREYDIRGIVGSEIPINATYDLTRSILAYMVAHNANLQTIAVGMDGRTHSEAIKEQVCSAIVDSGLHAIFIGLCPTPALYFSLHTLPVHAGIMITASHNPAQYNGLKLCLGRESLWGNQIRDIRTWYQASKKIISDTKGSVIYQPIHESYCSWLTSHFKHLKDLDMPLVIDCGNGTAGTVWPDVIKALNLKNAKLLYQEVDGSYPHHEADPTVERNMSDIKRYLAQNPLVAFGMGLDGDADRMAPMTNTGYLVPGDKLLALFSKTILEQNPGSTVVCDITSSSAVIKTLKKWGATVAMVPTGMANIKKTIKEEHALIGGELSCHFIFADRYFGFDDGIYAGLRLIELIHTSNQTLQDLLTVFPQVYSSRSIRIPCEPSLMPQMIATVRNYFEQQPEAHLITIDGVRATMPYGWGLIRASNTQPVISMRFESDTAAGLTKIKQDFTKLLSPYFDHDTLLTHMEL